MNSSLEKFLEESRSRDAMFEYASKHTRKLFPDQKMGPVEKAMTDCRKEIVTLRKMVENTETMMEFLIEKSHDPVVKDVCEAYRENLNIMADQALNEMGEEG